VKARQEFIEADYVNGIYDENGNEKMRPLTDHERDWLSQFYAETEHGNFKKTQEIEAQEKRYKQLCRELKDKRKHQSDSWVLATKAEIEEAYKKLVHLRAETNTFYPDDEDRHEIFNTGNKRKEDIYTLAKATKRLVNIDLAEMDQFTSKAEKDIEAEKLVLDYLGPAKKVLRKRKKL
jgi:hypothetical protein